VARFWWPNTKVQLSLNAFTAALIFVCSYILLLAFTFANATTVSILGSNKFYLKACFGY